jgi:D-glycero-D-manno-heptose 1,7-bisphosphate phosphatase
MIFKDLGIDKTWTLFLDRDGVINKRIIGGYIKTWDQFEFIPGVPESMRIFGSLFGTVIVVTNQQGVGKNLMTEDDLLEIHGRMNEEIAAAGGRVDKVYFSPHLETDGSFLRKPGIGMALKARRDFPGITMKKSIMAGDSKSDMIFGHRCNMKTVFIAGDKMVLRQNHKIIDFSFPNLLSFAQAL